jgi:hypothetical protein
VNELTDPERIRVAHHEAGHALVAELLGVRVDVVSVRAAERHRGVTIHASLRVDEIAELLARRDGPSLLARWGVTPYPFFDPEERRRAECLIKISLAGRLGELLMPEFSSGYRDDSADTDQAQAIATAAELTAEQDRWLVDAEHAKIPADDEHAFDTARGIAGDEGAAALVNHLTWETRRLMFSPLPPESRPAGRRSTPASRRDPRRDSARDRATHHWRNPEARGGDNDGTSSSQAG